MSSKEYPLNTVKQVCNLRRRHSGDMVLMGLPFVGCFVVLYLGERSRRNQLPILISLCKAQL